MRATEPRPAGAAAQTGVVGSVLVVDDLAPVREALGEQLVRRGYRVLEARSGVDALALLKRAAVDLVVSDLVMPGLDGLGLLRRVDRRGPPVVVFSARGDVPTAVEVMRAGAADFVPLPIDSEEFAERVTRFVRTRSTGRASALVGEHASLRALRDAVARLAGREASVLLTGESGVGKELVAREIHAASRRARRPFVAVNCCALSESLLESELFGHERGAFTGAAARKIGRFERAHGGTLFLDEIGDAPASTQAKLLRVLQEREFERVGGVEAVRVDVRVVAATNRDLARLREEGRFRDDLFHRLNVLPLRVPPLRERASDLPLLVDALCARSGLRLAWTDAALQRLAAHPWPGNVRELENTVERLGVLCDEGGLVTLERVELALDGSGEPQPGRRAAFHEEERTRYEALLREHRWNVSAVARRLGISRGALRHRMRRYGL